MRGEGKVNELKDFLAETHTGKLCEHNLGKASSDFDFDFDTVETFFSIFNFQMDILMMSVDRLTNGK